MSELTSGLSEGYAHRLNYNWTFHTQQSYHFKINITDMNMEGNNVSCLYDMIKILEPMRGDLSRWRVNKTVCGRSTGAFESPQKHIMKINFLTDSWVNRTGFNLTVTPVCGGVLYDSYGYISTEDVMNTERCWWIVMVRPGRTVQITFQRLNIADNNNCQNSYVLLSNGGRKSSPLLGGGRFCGQSIPSIPESSSNRVRVEFYARRDLHAVR